MATPTPMTIIVQIDGFCNCNGCIQKVKKTLRDLGGVKLLAMNPELGEFIISTANHVDVIKFAIQQTFPKKDVIVSPKLSHPNQIPTSITPQNPLPLVNPPNVHEIAKALVTVSHAEGLESVEFKQSNTLKVKFRSRENQVNQPSTSGSSSSSYARGSGGHFKDDGFGDVPGLPPPPPNASEPSAPLIPLSEDYVYGYPADQLYGGRRSSKYDDPRGCCAIL
ncbi:hypothetical protein LXL04_012339 [Taraxacum kok-saghyz]